MWNVSKFLENQEALDDEVSDMLSSISCECSLRAIIATWLNSSHRS